MVALSTLVWYGEKLMRIVVMFNRICRFACAVVLAVGISACVCGSAYAATYSKWISKVDGKSVQYSTYGPYESSGGYTATGRRITYSTRYIAVPSQYIVSKSTWLKHKSLVYRKTHFYYHEKIQLRKGNRTVTCSVEDCGGFKGYGGSKYERLFDITPAVYNALGVGQGVGVVKWRFLKA